MSEGKKIILIVDDSFINRQMLCNILNDEYNTIQAENGAEALEILREHGERISAVLLDVITPIMNGYRFLEERQKDKVLSNIPVIATTINDPHIAEIETLKRGATDFIQKPYNPTVVRQRVENIIKLRETAAFVNTVEHDALTGFYNREAFYAHARRYIDANSEKDFDFIAMDLNDFKIVNDMFGENVGDELLKCWSKIIENDIAKNGMCGRISGDVFAVVMPGHREYSEELFEGYIEKLNRFDLNFTLKVKFGIYHVEDKSLPLSLMCDRALLAIKAIKDDFRKTFSYYDESLKEKLWNEQELTNTMRNALKTGQFHVYLQPKYDLYNNTVSGAEALVRWIHPEKGFMPPITFIPLFEKNGFITELDMYVCDKVCQIIRSWIDEGIEPVPVSINVSRVDIYNPALIETINKCVKKYDIPVKYLHIEITETSYTENSMQLKDVVLMLRKEGYHIEMDDFGSGYSSLNMLNDIPVDTLKLDMGFLKKGERTGRDETVMSFVVSLAKKLSLSVIAEGVEKKDEAEFLRSLGCDYAQGYLYSKPVPVDEFNKDFVKTKRPFKGIEEKEKTDFKDVDSEALNDILDTSDFNKIFDSSAAVSALMEYDGKDIYVKRTTKDFRNFMNEITGKTGPLFKLREYMSEKDFDCFKDCFEKARKNGHRFDIILPFSENVEKKTYIRFKAKILSKTGDKYEFMADVENADKFTDEKGEIIFNGEVRRCDN